MQSKRFLENATSKPLMTSMWVADKASSFHENSRIDATALNIKQTICGAEVPSPKLHPELVESLRVLFDILDTSRTGRVRYETLCARFRELKHPLLPPTFLSCVGKVASANGFDKRRMQGPAMGVNGLDRRSAIFGSQPTLNENRYFRAHSVEGVPSHASMPTCNPLYLPIYDYANPYDIEQHVAMPSKKGNTVRSQKVESRMRHAVPPANVVPKVVVNRRRPQSTASHNSLASSGLESIAWRNSSLSTSGCDSQCRNTLCEDDPAPRTAKLDGLLKEEFELVQKGMETATKLLSWYRERMASLEKRKRLLGHGMVALDVAVHEQKLNFLRAHLTELNRRMVSLMESSERGFPSHVMLQKDKLPQQQDDQLAWLHRQNLMLTQVTQFNEV
ncbi:hypothetical protein TELCIR_08815 [Teladorsagia circumcincta]|uniref:Suppressor APC domain-containing protein n=1 Tax=Teladorsagia circumcincta TaxID=45464 RepID=A0A2G9UGI7_TELCI|nr:hypothetical protein TELCIR_08815 [Teladorsagia circumcincta]